MAAARMVEREGSCALEASDGRGPAGDRHATGASGVPASGRLSP